MEEIWKDIYYKDIITEEIIDYRGLYQVSNFGNVKSLERLDNNNHIVKEKILKKQIYENGYLYVNLRKNGCKLKHFKIHRLVAYMFILNNDKEKWQINHKDENPKNNNVNNLEWCTPKYNLNYGNRNKKSSESTIGINHWNHTSVVQYDINNNKINVFYSSREAERNTGIYHNDIIRCCKFWKINCNKEEWFKKYKRNPQKTAGGFIWKYYGEDDINE